MKRLLKFKIKKTWDEMREMHLFIPMYTFGSSNKIYGLTCYDDADFEYATRHLNNKNIEYTIIEKDVHEPEDG